jgi:hypothetical protein
MVFEDSWHTTLVQDLVRLWCKHAEKLNIVCQGLGDAWTLTAGRKLSHHKRHGKFFHILWVQTMIIEDFAANRKQPVWTDHLSLYISTVSPYKLKKRRSHQNCSEWQNKSYGKCQFLQKLESRLISHFSFGQKESRFLFIQSKNLCYSIQGSI